MGDAMTIAIVEYAVTGTTWSRAGARRGIEAAAEHDVILGAGVAARGWVPRVGVNEQKWPKDT